MLRSTLFNQKLLLNINRSVTNSGINVGNDLGCSVTGTGPFVQLPNIMPLGNPGGFVKVLLPRASSINVQSTSVSFIKGELSKLSARMALQCGDMWYQELTSKDPCTLLLSNNELSQTNQTYVSVSRHQNWTLFDSRDLLAWSGLDLSISRRSSGLHVAGAGFFIVRGRGNIHEYELEKGESIILKGEALIATSGSIENNINIDRSSKVSPAMLAGITSRLKSGLSYLRKFIIRITPREWHKSIGESSTALTHSPLFVWASKLKTLAGINGEVGVAYIKVCGPGQVLVQTSLQS